MNQHEIEQLIQDNEEMGALLAEMDEDERAAFKEEMFGLINEMEDMFEAFENRTIYDTLSTEILAKISDEELVLTVFDTLAVQAPEDLGEADFLASLSPARRAVYALYILAGEVDNGGFNQYFYNTEAEAAAYLPESCELIGAPAYADLTRQAYACYQQEKIGERQDGTLENFSASYENNPLTEYDDRFYKLEKEQSLDELLVRFIRSHINEFTD